MINWQFYPKSREAPSHLIKIINIFEKYENEIKSPENNLKSNEVLSVIRKDLEALMFKVERGKKKEEKIAIPVLFGLKGKIEKYFEADAYKKETNTVIEVEAGRGVLNNQFLKDLFQACMMQQVKYLVTAVRNNYLGKDDFRSVIAFYDALYASGRLILPLKGVLIIGY
jgi:hypothetical protein